MLSSLHGFKTYESFISILVSNISEDGNHWAATAAMFRV